MTKVALVFRSKERKEFSIEALFECLKEYINKKVETKDFFLPYGRYNRPGLLLKNVLYSKSIQAEIYHITGEVNFVALSLPKGKTIITVHDYVDLETLTGIKKAIRWLFWCYIPYKRSRYLACISEKTLRETVERFPFTKDKVKYIPNPIDDSYRSVIKEFDESEPRILVMGTRVNKNVERIIEAVRGIPCELFIIGILTNEQKQLLEKTKVKYQNVYHIPDDDIRQAYCSCDLLCFPSTYEGFGRPIIEANAIGRPVVTSNIEPMIEVADGSAVLVDPYDVDSIRSGILEVIRDKIMREKMIKRGYENAEKYRAEIIAQKYVELYAMTGED